MNESDKGLKEYLEIVRRRFLTVASVALGFFTLMWAYAYLTTPVYRGSSLVNIERPTDVVLVAVAQQVTSQPQDEEYFSTQAKLIVSDTALRKVYDDLRLAETEEFGAGVRRLRKAVAVLAVPKTRLAFVNADSTDPQLALAISSALAANFVQANLDNQLFMSRNALSALQTRARGSEAVKVYEALPAVVKNPLIQNIKTEIVKAEALRADLASKYRDGHPAVVAASAQLALMRGSLDREVMNVVRSLQTELSGQLRPNNVRIVDVARLPEKPVKPRRQLALLLGVVGGLFAGVLAALGIENLDDTVRGRADLEEGLGLPVLGQVQMRRRRRGEKVYAALVAPQATASSEALRDIRTMVSLSDASGGGRCVLVTSAVEREGKSFLAANLAVALSQLGLRVLLVDGDLRRPTLHAQLGVPGTVGLTDYLSGRAASPEAVVQATETPSLHLAACGPRPASPAELLHGPRLEGFVDWARARYDRIVIDCPPLGPVSDALLWGLHARAAIVVARRGHTPLPALRTACERLRTGGVTVVGAVLNGARSGGRALERYYRAASSN